MPAGPSGKGKASAEFEAVYVGPETSAGERQAGPYFALSTATFFLLSCILLPLLLLLLLLLLLPPPPMATKRCRSPG